MLALMLTLLLRMVYVARVTPDRFISFVAMGGGVVIGEDLNVKDIGLFPGIGENSFLSSGRKISEDTDRELSITDTDNSEPSSERDSQRDKPTPV